MSYNLIDEIVNLLGCNRDVRINLNNREEGEVIINMLKNHSYLDLDITIYTNCSGQLLLSASYII